MVAYTLAETPELRVAVRGKDSPDTRNRALEKISKMVDLGELNPELIAGLNAEGLVITEAPTRASGADGDVEPEPLEMAIRELQKCLFLKLRTQRLRHSANQARQNIAAVLAEDSAELDLDQIEETLKGNFKTLKEYVNSLREFRQARPGAEAALALLDEALQVNLSILAIPNAKANSSTVSETSPSQPEASEAKNQINNEVGTTITETKESETTADEVVKNGKQRRADVNSSKSKSN